MDEHTYQFLKENHLDDIAVFIMLTAGIGFAIHKFYQIKTLRQQVKINDGVLTGLIPPNIQASKQ